MKWTLQKPGNDSAKDRSQLARCLFCGYHGSVVWVHGHGQCSNCGINIHECCSGEQCEPVKRSDS